MINNLKKQINDFKQIIKIKDEEISNLKINSKVSKYNILENEYKVKNEENFVLRENLNRLKDTLIEYILF